MTSVPAGFSLFPSASGSVIRWQNGSSEPPGNQCELHLQLLTQLADPALLSCIYDFAAISKADLTLHH